MAGCLSLAGGGPEAGEGEPDCVDEVVGAGTGPGDRATAVWCEQPSNAKTQSASVPARQNLFGMPKKTVSQELRAGTATLQVKNVCTERSDPTQFPDWLVCSHFLRVL